MYLPCAAAGGKGNKTVVTDREKRKREPNTVKEARPLRVYETHTHTHIHMHAQHYV